MERLAKLEKLFDSVNAEEKTKKNAYENIVAWIENDDLAQYRPYIQYLIESGAGEVLLDAFWRMIPFGTGGRRGAVGVGPNRINPYTVALSVQGHCDYLRKVLMRTGALSVVVAHDVREFFDLRGVYPGVDGVLNHLTSRDLARVSAETYAANGITAFVVGPLLEEESEPICRDRYISTPELSFLIREMGAAGGLNISASHNHPDDNGTKFYNSDGGQDIPPDDENLLNVVEAVTTIKTMSYREARVAGLIRFVPRPLHEAYIEHNKALCPTDSRAASVAFTPLSGTGTFTVGETLKALGFETHFVTEQAAPDGSFKAVRYRIGNPEVPDSMDKLRDLAAEKGCDIGFSSDPDADRLGVIVPDGGGGFSCLSGNEIGVVLLESILQIKKRTGALTKRSIFANTLVTTSLQREIARAYGCQVIGDLMVGCKYMADVIKNIDHYGIYPPEDHDGDWDSVQGTVADYVFSCEESHGYLVSLSIRDKDACGAAVHLSGLASILKDRNSSVLEMLNNIYRVYGYICNRQRSLVMEGIAGLERIALIQEALRRKPPKRIAGRRVVRFVDNQVVGGAIKSATDQASRNVLLFELENGENAPVRLIVRPSGTEPKTKIYVEVLSTNRLGGVLFDKTSAELSTVSDADLQHIKSAANAVAAQIANAFIRYCLGAETLGPSHPVIPETALLVSDLVSVEQKIRLVREILPELAERFSNGESQIAVEKWLVHELRPFGEDPRGLVREAVAKWLSDNCSGMSSELSSQIEQVFRQGYKRGG